MSGLPDCTIDIYPYEGGTFTFNGANGTLLECAVSKNIRDPQSGTFELTIAPNGPFGPDADPQWLNIITPMSLVVITMQRLGRAHIVMIGVVNGVQEDETWRVNAGVRRALSVQGRDFAYIFSQPNFYASLLFNFSRGSVLTPGVALGNVLSLGAQNVTLQQAASTWYSKIMAGTTGLLSNMTFAYQGSRVSFDSLMATLFGNYPNLKLQIPVAQIYALLNGTWLDTFGGIYVFPWFELFVTTAEAGDYGQPAAKAPIVSSRPGVNPASPCLIARPTPIPTISGTTGTFSVDLSLWNALPVFTLDTTYAISRSLRYTDSEVKNFYAICPSYLGTTFGGSNSDIAPLLYSTGVWVDSGSLERYGYRPFIPNPAWFADVTGDVARSTAQNGGIKALVELVGEIALKAASYFEPTPLMAKCDVVTNLRPDIQIGTRLQLPVSKDMELWDFYIDGVDHHFVFGGSSITALTLSRGLPADSYQDQNLIKAMLSGNAMRQDGNYRVGLQPGAGAPLKLINFGNGVDITSQIAAAWNIPGQK